MSMIASVQDSEGVSRRRTIESVDHKSPVVRFETSIPPLIIILEAAFLVHGLRERAWKVIVVDDLAMVF